MFSLRKEKEKPGTFSLAAMVFIFHQMKSSLGSGCRQTPSLPARCHVCLRLWECVGVWVLFCFLHRLCRPSPALAHRSLQGSAQLHYPPGWTSHFCATALCGAALLLQELPETRLAAIAALWVLQSCGHCQSLREGACVEGRVPRLGAAGCWHGCAPWDSTKQGTSAASQQESTSH